MCRPEIGYPQLQHPIPAFPKTVFIPSSFRRIESILLNTNEKHTFKDPYDIPAGGKSSNNICNKCIGRYNEKTTHIKLTNLSKMFHCQDQF